MALSEAPRQSANQEQNQPDTNAHQRPSHAEDYETATQRLKSEPAANSADQAQAGAGWHPLPPNQHSIAQQTPYARRHAALRRRLTRANLRRAHHKEVRQSHKLILGSLLGTAIPLFLLVMLLGGATGLALLYYASQRSALASIAQDFPADSLKIYDSSGTLIDELNDQGTQTTVPLKQISPNVTHATIAIEDKDFWTNQGVDFMAVVRAAADDLRSGQIVSGASSLSNVASLAHK
jgi:hypothetical protein